MESLEALRLMLDRSGTTAYRVAVDIGRSPSYVSSMLRRGSVPSADLLARIAAACDYDLRLVPRGGGESIELDGGEPVSPST